MRRVIRTGLPVDLRATLAPMRRGGSRDPCFRSTPAGTWRATRVPSGSTTLLLRQVAPRTVEAEAWGDGAEEVLTRAPAMVGADDDDGGLARSPNPFVRGLAQRLPGIRMGRSGNVFEALVPTILEQKVQGRMAKASFCAMVRAAGEPAPHGGLLLPPTPAWLGAQPGWRWHRWGVEEKRARTVRIAASYAHRLDDVSRLRALPGVGVWSEAEVAAVALGDPDAVSVGDYHLCHWVTYNLAGEPRGTDERMLELLAPFRGQRGRVCRLLMLGGEAPPRYGPRLALQELIS
jgi:3-methyladenine DNA glycosylase/8-oxoguanine DNA glycosylase